MDKTDRDRIEGIATRAALETLTAAQHSGGLSPRAIALAIGRAIGEVEADREWRVLHAADRLIADSGGERGES